MLIFCVRRVKSHRVYTLGEGVYSLGFSIARSQDPSVIGYGGDLEETCSWFSLYGDLASSVKVFLEVTRVEL